METIRKIKIYAFLCIGIIFLTSTIAMSSGKIRVLDFKYEKHEFLNGDVVLELPDKPQIKSINSYDKILVDEYVDLTTGHVEISVANVNKYNGLQQEKFENKLVTENIKRIYKDSLSISRIAVWYSKTPLILRVRTSFSNDTFSTEAEKQDRIRKDNEIFEHIIESFRYRKEDGTYAKPEIIRQKEEVKEIEFHGAEYHGGGNK